MPATLRRTAFSLPTAGLLPHAALRARIAWLCHFARAAALGWAAWMLINVAWIWSDPAKTAGMVGRYLNADLGSVTSAQVGWGQHRLDVKSAEGEVTSFTFDVGWSGTASADVDESSDNVQLSGDGSTVVFDSPAANLIAGDFNALSDVFAEPTAGDVVDTVAV